MKSVIVLGGGAVFLAGVSTSLLASYPIPENSIFVCFVALFVALASSLLGAAAIACHAALGVNQTTRSERVTVDHLIETTVEHLLHRRGLELVEDD